MPTKRAFAPTTARSLVFYTNNRIGGFPVVNCEHGFAGRSATVSYRIRIDLATVHPWPTPTVAWHRTPGEHARHCRSLHNHQRCNSRTSLHNHRDFIQKPGCDAGNKGSENACRGPHWQRGQAGRAPANFIVQSCRHAPRVSMHDHWQRHAHFPRISLDPHRPRRQHGKSDRPHHPI